MIPLQQQQYKFYQLMARIDMIGTVYLIITVDLIIQKIKKEKWKQQQQVAKVDSSD